MSRIGPPGIEEIQEATARYFDITRNRILSQDRHAEYVRPRQIAMYLCSQMTVYSYRQIGLLFGGKDHSTVLHAVDRVAELMATHPGTKLAVERILGEFSK